MITLNGASKQLESLKQQHKPPARIHLVEDETLLPGWVWLCWGSFKIKAVQRGLWNAL